MADFLTASLCRGVRPRRLSAVRVRPRSDLIARLMRERQVARFLVAPGGYGKTSLACAYAETVFSFEHTFWIDCRSPCFLRDLDRGDLAEQLLARDGQARLAVFDDVFRIDEGRADAFSQAIDHLLGAGCEVIVTLAPSCDAYARRQPDRIRLGAPDLMLDDEEVSLLRGLPQTAGRFAPGDGSAARVPVLAWGGEDRYDVLLDGLMREELSDELTLAAFAMLALANGRLGRAARIASACQSDATVTLAQGYPYLGIDEASGEFSAARIPVARLVQRASPRLADLAAAAGCAGKDELMLRIADELLAAGDAQRACELVSVAVTRPVCAEWLLSRSDDLQRIGALASACRLFALLRIPRTSEGASLRLGQARRLALLDDEPRALEEAVRVALAPYASEETRAEAALVAFELGESSERARMLDVMARSLGVGGGRIEHAGHDGCDGQANQDGRVDWGAALEEGEWAKLSLAYACDGLGAWAVPVSVALALEHCPQQALHLWEAWHDAGAPSSSLCHAAALLANAEAVGFDGRHRTASFVRAQLDRLVSEGDEVGPAAFAAARAFGEARELDPSLPPLAPHVASAVNRTAEVLQEQRVLRRRAVQEHASALACASASARRAAASRRADDPGYPVLGIRLFGGLEVSVGDERVNQDHFRRQKVKTLLALLAVNAGRELPRDRLVEDLWPASPIDAARRNFYTVWSGLRRALVTADGQCPYLVRMQNGYKLDDRALSTDVRRVDELCRTMLVGRADARSWSELLSELGDAYAGELLPSETANETVLRLREEYRTRVVDALVTASVRLADEGEAQGALWYARTAFEHERAREDVYAALMRAQIAVGQRTSALETYFACRTFLADELGIDPSAGTVRLYRSIIEEEETLDW